MEGSSERPPSGRLASALALVYLAFLLAQASIAPLQEPDEGRLASIAGEMAGSGDWVTPRLNGIRYYEKPPLCFWMAAAAVRAFGHADVCVRLPSVLASFLTVLLTAHWGSRAGGRRTGILCGSILASLTLFALFARVALVDPLLTLFISAALYSADRLLLDPSPPGGRRRPWHLGFWIAVALAALVKGPVGIVLPLASALGFLLLVRDARGLRALLRPDGLLLFALVCGPWYVAMSLRNPDYPAEFLLGQNLDRFVEGARFNRDKPFWYHVPVLLVGFLPWSLFLPKLVKALRDSFARRAQPDSRRPLFLSCAVVVPFAILSVAHSKLPHYLLPLCPPFALLLGGVLAGDWNGADGRAPAGAGILRLFGILVLAFAAAVLVPAWMDPETVSRGLGYHATDGRHAVDLARIRRFQTPLPGAGAILGAAGIGALVAAEILRRGRPRAGVLFLSASMLSAVVGVQFLVAPMGPAISARALAAKAERHRSADAPVVLYRRHLRGMTWYLQRPVVLWEALYNEFGHEVGAEGDAVSLGGRASEVGPYLDRHPDAVLVLDDPERLEELKGCTTKTFETMDREGDFLVVRVRRD